MLTSSMNYLENGLGYRFMYLYQGKVSFYESKSKKGRIGLQVPGIQGLRILPDEEFPYMKRGYHVFTKYGEK